MSVKTIFDKCFTNFARHFINVSKDGEHAEWVLFRHGSLYFRTMPNNVETSSGEIIFGSSFVLFNIAGKELQEFGKQKNRSHLYFGAFYAKNRIVVFCFVL